MAVFKKIQLTCSLVVLGLTTISCHAFEGHATSKDGRVNVTYKVEDGFKVSVRIDTAIKKPAYQSFENSDVSSIGVSFADVNRDGYIDVLIQHADETGYVPVVLVNQSNRSFTDALMDAKKQFRTAFYVNTEVDLIEEGRRPSGMTYELKDLDGDGMPELVFYNAFIDNKGYRYVAFQLDKGATNYHLYKRGKMFLDQSQD